MDSPKFSIIIPTAFDKGPLLQKCVESIIEFSPLEQIEIIVVANGVTGQHGPIPELLCLRYLIFTDAIGYPKAVNAGIAEAKGEFVVLLNNDTEILGPGWLDALVAPFVAPKVAVTGPMKEFCEHAGHDFILFFCACIRKSVIDELGALDEIFSPGYSEDVDFCCRVQEAGYSVVQVPDDNSHDYYAPSRRTGDFPIYHAGNQTFKDHPDDSLIIRNAAIVAARYGNPTRSPAKMAEFNIANALKIGGATSQIELTWLARAAQRAQIVVEVGSWAGRSSRALADNLPPGGKLYCIDTWAGSSAEPDMKAATAGKDGDAVYDEFCRNLRDHIQSGTVVPLRMHSRHAAPLLSSWGVRADLIFIDAAHTFPEVQEDLGNFVLIKPDGVICGHDYGPNPAFGNREMWPGVKQAVDQAYGDKVSVCDGGTIWSVNSPPQPQAPKAITRDPCVFDCFTFNNELDVLERRLATMWDAADRFIIVEGDTTHGGNPKDLVFHNNLPRFQKYLSKITYIVVQDWPEVRKGVDPDWSWVYERFQRDAIMRGLTQYQDDDVIIISDCDEIPNPAVIERFKMSGMKIAALEMELFVYDEKTKAIDPWREARIMRGKWLRGASPCQARYTQCPAISDAGIHLSWQGGTQAIIKKIEDTAHQELNTEEFKNPLWIDVCINEGLDLFQRPNIKFEKVK